MELLIVVAVFFLLYWSGVLIGGQLQKIRDRAAQETLENINIDFEKQDVEKLSKIFLSRISLSRCPKCKSIFKIKENENEVMWICGEYPKCDYVKGRVPNGIL